MRDSSSNEHNDLIESLVDLRKKKERSSSVYSLSTLSLVFVVNRLLAIQQKGFTRGVENFLTRLLGEGTTVPGTGNTIRLLQLPRQLSERGAHAIRTKIKGKRRESHARRVLPARDDAEYTPASSSTRVSPCGRAPSLRALKNVTRRFRASLSFQDNRTMPPWKELKRRGSYPRSSQRESRTVTGSA